MGHVVLGDDQVLAPVILASDHNVSVRMSGVVVIDSHPIEFGAKINLSLRHHIIDKGLEVSELGSILG